MNLKIDIIQFKQFSIIRLNYKFIMILLLKYKKNLKNNKFKRIINEKIFRLLLNYSKKFFYL